MPTGQRLPENLGEVKAKLLASYGPALTHGYRTVAESAITRTWLMAVALLESESLKYDNGSSESKVLRALAKRMLEDGS